jgi:hypothetical protein
MQNYARIEFCTAASRSSPRQNFARLDICTAAPATRCKTHRLPMVQNSPPVRRSYPSMDMIYHISISSFLSSFLSPLSFSFLASHRKAHRLCPRRRCSASRNEVETARDMGVGQRAASSPRAQSQAQHGAPTSIFSPCASKRSAGRDSSSAALRGSFALREAPSFFPYFASKDAPLSSKLFPPPFCGLSAPAR